MGGMGRKKRLKWFKLYKQKIIKIIKIIETCQGKKKENGQTEPQILVGVIQDIHPYVQPSVYWSNLVHPTSRPTPNK